MRKADAEKLVIQLWRAWPSRDDPPSPAKGLLFYNWLVSKRPDALSFTTRVTDKWQIVSGWLNRHHLK